MVFVIKVYHSWPFKTSYQLVKWYFILIIKSVPVEHWKVYKQTTVWGASHQLREKKHWAYNRQVLAGRNLQITFGRWETEPYTMTNLGNLFFVYISCVTFYTIGIYSSLCFNSFNSPHIQDLYSPMQYRGMIYVYQYSFLSTLN